jgi:ribosomal protein S18 acetylase RimI-like enzyme
VALEIRFVSPEWEQPLAEFFTAIRMSGEQYFHPHPFTDESAKTLAHYCGKDLYYLLLDGRTVLAYGILRGWDQGYEIPSLGIAVHPEARGGKLGELMMHFLHSAARRKGARQVRLKVYGGNVSARNLYIKLGYRFDSVEEEGQLVGRLEL